MKLKISSIFILVISNHSCPFVADTNWTSIKPGLMEEKGSLYHADRVGQCKSVYGTETGV